MSFLFPLGLLGLLAIPVIILIYILQSKYTEQTVTSTYIWQLSDKFLKRRNPFSGLSGMISLILQILTVTVLSLIIAHPVFTLPGAAKDYYFLLDATGSMNTVDEEESRMELAKDAIEKVIKRSRDGSSYSLVALAGDSVTVYDNLRNKKDAIELLRATDASDTTLSYSDMLSYAQGVFEESPSSLLYLVTDKGYTKHDNIEVIDVGGDNTQNHAVFDTTYSYTGGVLSVSANIISYSSDASLTVKLYVDDTELLVKRVEVKANERTPVALETKVERFSSYRVQIVEEDGYPQDNSVTSYNLTGDKTYKTLIVSETGFFLRAVIDSLIDAEIEIIKPEEYEQVSGTYGLYIFDSCVPKTLPDASVWLINADRSVDDAGFGIRGKVELGDPDVIQKSNSTATGVRKLLRGVEGKDIYISDYVKYSGMYLNFFTLFTYDSNPLIFAGANGLGNRQVVFGFDLHQSDFALSTDFVMLMRNLLEYSFPNVIDSTDYTVGEEVSVNIVANAANLKALSPSGKDIFMESTGTVAALPLDEIGTYTISLTVSGTPVTYRIYSGAHPDESEPVGTEAEFSLSGNAIDANIDGRFDPTILLFAILAFLFLADWGVYCYEKYQLR